MLLVTAVAKDVSVLLLKITSQKVNEHCLNDRTLYRT